MANSKIIPKKGNEEWFDKAANRWAAILTILAFVFSAGIWIGNYQKDLEQQLILIKKEQDCNQLIQEEKYKCAEFRREFENKQLENLKKTVDELDKIIGDRKK